MVPPSIPSSQALPGTRVLLDTNVLVDLLASVDLVREVDLAGNLSDPRVRGRVQRVRNAVALGWHLHATSARTLSLATEARRVFFDLVPSQNSDFVTGFTTVAAHFLMDFVLPGWRPDQTSLDEGCIGNDCDRVLVGLAAALGLPIISNEQEGRTLRTEAERAGVRVFFPAEFEGCGRHTDEAIRQFIHTFDQTWPRYVRTQPEELAPHLERALQHVRAYYSRVLLEP